MASETWGSRPPHFMIIPHTKCYPDNTKTDQLPIFEVITGLPGPYLHTTVKYLENDLKPKTKSRANKERLSAIGQIAETSMRDPDTSRLFFHFF